MWITLLVVFFIYFLDQITKWASQKFITAGESVVLIPNFLKLENQQNTGAAFSLGDNGGMIIFVIISFIGTGVLIYMAAKNDWKKKPIYSIGVSLALAGCVGNLFDRLLYVIPASSSWRGGVQDMINCEFFNAIFRLFGQNAAVFNVADFFLITGVCFLILYVILCDIKDSKNKKKQNDVKKMLAKEKYSNYLDSIKKENTSDTEKNTVDSSSDTDAESIKANTETEKDNDEYNQLVEEYEKKLDNLSKEELVELYENMNDSKD